jgi:small GTP-binding protein
MRYLNLGILAHVDAGKTTLTERLLYAAGIIDEIGRVDDGTTQTDTLELERQRGITIKAAVVSFVVEDVTINLIDTPGHPDFIAEVERVLSVLDGAVLVISAVEGVQSQTRILMGTLRRLGIPTLIFVNKIDRRGAREAGLLRDIADRLTPSVIAMGSTHALGARTASFSQQRSGGDFLDRLVGAEPIPSLATVGLRIDPAPLDTGVEFRLEVELGSMPYSFFRAVEETVREALGQGLYGWRGPGRTPPTARSPCCTSSGGWPPGEVGASRGRLGQAGSLCGVLTIAGSGS